MLTKAFLTLRTWLNSRIVRQYIGNSFWMSAARCCWIITAFTVGILVTRRLGPKDFGILHYVIAYVGMFSVIANLGIDTFVERDMIRYPEKRHRILGNYFMFRVVSTAVMLLCMTGSLLFMKEKQYIFYCILYGSGFLFHPFNAVACYFSATVQNEYSAWSQIASCILYNGIRLAAVFCSASLTVYVAAESVLAGINGLFLILCYRHADGSPFRWSFRWKEVIALLPPAIPLSLTSLFSVIYARTDILMLDYFKGVESVGYYTIATRFTENWALFIALFAQVFSTAVISAGKISESEYEKQLHRYYFMLFWITVPPILLTVFLSKWVIVFLYGTAFLPSASVLCVFVLTLPFNGLLSAFSCHAVNGNRLKTIAFVFASGALINVPLNALLIRFFNAEGAALSSVLSMPLGFILVLVFTEKGRKDLIFLFHSLFTLPSFRLNKGTK